MNFTKRRPFLLWLQSVVVVVVVLSNTLVQVYAEIESIASLLSPELQHTRVVYEETGDTYVSFPDDANDLLAQELSDYPSPLVLEVTTVVTQWHDPLWDLLKGQVSRFQDEHHLVSVEAHYFVGNGMGAHGCRMEWLDETTGEMTELPSTSDPCHQNCTNHGRYCAPEVPSDWNPAIPPRQLVEETLRRLCLDRLDHSASNLQQYFEYLAAWEQLQCPTTTDLTACAKQALQQVAPTTDGASVDECMLLAGGLESDVMNGKLQEEVDRQQGSYALSDIPMLHIQGKQYTGPWTVDSVFQAVCAAFPSSQRQTPKSLPLACDFCGHCQDVRKCLWHLDCDGEPFDSLTFRNKHAGSQGETAVPPLLITPPPITPPPISWFNHTDNRNSPPPPTLTATTKTTSLAAIPAASANDTSEIHETVSTTGFFLAGILAGFVVGVLPTCCLAQRERRTRRLIAAALATREQRFWDNTSLDGRYKDELELSSGRSARPSQEELRNLDDISLDEVGAPQRQQQQIKEPPRMVFGLQQVV